MNITASTLRNNVYQLLDQVLESGEPLTIERKGRQLKIVREGSVSRLSKLIRHECIKGDPESFVHMDWSSELHHDLP